MRRWCGNEREGPPNGILETVGSWRLGDGCTSGLREPSRKPLIVQDVSMDSGGDGLGVPAYVSE